MKAFMDYQERTGTKVLGYESRLLDLVVDDKIALYFPNGKSEHFFVDKVG